ncbi:hypothetical protein EW146_g456 [Bondarzewia mesenterica]|uniref:C2H2-type domain-containing protein n=1 Tax=Bondarzewia mesenterica TaxID=1095465 RepID=A0A4S4M6U8_9AGAM|nr:hypothetical protein EW146_g456 [Bondarzewia mesenterica]
MNHREIRQEVDASRAGVAEEQSTMSKQACAPISIPLFCIDNEKTRWRILTKPPKPVAGPSGQSSPHVRLDSDPQDPLGIGRPESKQYWIDLAINGLNMQADETSTPSPNAMAVDATPEMTSGEFNSNHSSSPIPNFQPTSSSPQAALACLGDAHTHDPSNSCSSSGIRPVYPRASPDAPQVIPENSTNPALDVDCDIELYPAPTSSQVPFAVAQTYPVEGLVDHPIDPACSSPIPSSYPDTGSQSTSSTPPIATPPAPPTISFPTSADTSATINLSTKEHIVIVSPPQEPPPRLSLSSRPKPSRVSKKVAEPKETPPILSATLAASADPSILGYACGYSQCWPDDDSCSKFRFATSKDLSEHVRIQHPGDPDADSKPYRCGLQGCGKACKSINGLQYHLQISKAHFRQAISSFPPLAPSTQDAQATQTSDQERQFDTPKKKKTYSCPHANCLHVYKQLSGLRYHLTHSHPRERPAQLDNLPPTLARKVAEKMQREGGGN